MNQFTLFDLDEIPVITPEQRAADNRRWYISVMHNGKEHILTATHSDGTLEWSEVGTFRHQPHLYKSSAGALRMGHSYVKPGTAVTVKEWKGWK